MNQITYSDVEKYFCEKNLLRFIEEKLDKIFTVFIQ